MKIQVKARDLKKGDILDCGGIKRLVGLFAHQTVYFGGSPFTGVLYQVDPDTLVTVEREDPDAEAVRAIQGALPPRMASLQTSRDVLACLREAGWAVEKK